MIHRRELLLVGAGALAAKATATAIACASEAPSAPKDKGADPKGKTETKDEHAGHPAGAEHDGHPPAESGTGAASAFADTAGACVRAGNDCLAHCLRRLADGDKSMGECGRTVSEMLPVCQMVGALAASGSSHLPTAAKLCHDVCTACAKACKPHAGHHAECKACLAACEASIAEAKKHMV